MKKWYNGNNIWLEGDCPVCAKVDISYRVEDVAACKKHNWMYIESQMELYKIFYGQEALNKKVQELLDKGVIKYGTPNQGH